MEHTKSLAAYRTYFVEHTIDTKDKFKKFFPYTLSSRDVAVVFSKIDLKKNLDKDKYNTNSTDYLRGGKYVYSFADLTARYNYLFDHNNNSALTGIIATSEQEGKAQSISTHDGYEQYVAKFGTDSAVFFWMQNYFLEVADPATLSYVYKATSKLFTATTKNRGAVKDFVTVLKKLFKSDAAQKLVDELPQTLKPLANTLESSNFIKLAKTPDGTLGIYALQSGIDDVVEIARFEGDKLVVNTHVLSNSTDEVITKLTDDISVTDANGNALTDITFAVDEGGEVKVSFKNVEGEGSYLKNLARYKQLFKQGKVEELFAELKKTKAFPKMGKTRVRNHTDLLAEYKAKYGPNANNYPYSTTDPVTDFELAETGYFVRVFTGESKNSSWIFRIEDLRQYGGVDEIVEKLALPNKPTKVRLVELPQGVKLRKSIAGSQNWKNGTIPKGGGTQYEIIGGRSNDWFKPLFDEINDFFK